ncbi:MAG: hypothetical protein ACE5H9_06250, partial [Anaerolineae bacterium]
NSVVVRRGSSFYVGGPADATIQIDELIDPNSCDSSNPFCDLTDLSPEQHVCGAGRWRITIPSNATVGKYRITLQRGSWSKSLNLNVIFDMPTGLNQADLEAFAYSNDPSNTRDEYSIFYTTSDWPWELYEPWHQSNGYGFAFETDQYEQYILETYVMDAINGVQDKWGIPAREWAAIQLAKKADANLYFEDESIRYNMKDALPADPNTPRKWAQCSTHANVLTGFARSAGIAARPAGADWDNWVAPYDLFDYSTEVLTENGWKVLRAYAVYEVQNGEEVVLQGGIVWPRNLNQYFYDQSSADMIVAGNSNWDMSQLNTNWDQPKERDFTVPNYNKTIMIKWDWVDTEAVPFWNWSQEPTDVGDPMIDWIQWPANTPTPTPTPTDTPTPTPTPTNTPTPTATSNGGGGGGNGGGASGSFLGLAPTHTPTATPEAGSAASTSSAPTSSNAPAGPYLPVIAKSLQPPAVELGQVIADSGRDLDGDGRLDQLVIDVAVNVNQPGDYTFGGLIDNDEFEDYTRVKGLATAVTEVHLEAGPQVIQLTFNGQTISQARVNGPFQVTHLWVSDLTLEANTLDLMNNRIDTAEPDYTTAAYQRSDFENLGASLSNDYSHQAYDTDKDGYFDTLVINTGLDITEGGTYRVEGALADGKGEVVATASWTGSDGQVALQFEALLGDVTAYHLQSLRLYDADGGLIDSTTGNSLLNTGVYSTGPLYNLGLTAIESAQSVTPTVVNVATPDLDQDGDFDSLDFTVNAVIAVEGDYRLEGWLEGNNGALIAWQTSGPVHLTPGSQNLLLSFDGSTINNFRANGPYKLTGLKLLFGTFAYQIINEVNVAYETAAYSFDQFDNSLSGNIILNDGMENGSGNWNLGETSWELIAGASYSPVHSWTDSPDGDYTSTDTMLTSNSVALPRGAEPILSFQTCYNINPDGDQGELQVSADGGAWNTLNKATAIGDSNGWLFRELSLLSPTSGASSIEFRFLMDANGSGYADGWYVDDVILKLDLDMDDDGISNDDEIGPDLGNPTDTDNDGVPDYQDTDSDNDGIPDAVEGSGDTDGDGTPDYQDTDSDNDGIPDLTEGSGDTDNDGTPDFQDTDSDNDTIPDAVEGSGDTDGDGTPDFQDTDSDDDTIPDAVEGSGDTDGDGTPDYLDTDSDNDGIPDTYDPFPGQYTYVSFLPLVTKR